VLTINNNIVPHGTAFTVVATSGRYSNQRTFRAASSYGVGSNGFFDSFVDGLSPNEWYISRRRWGVVGSDYDNTGQSAQNVDLTYCNMLVLTANGDYYQGSRRGALGGAHGRRSGAAVFTQERFGPGSFEVRMRVMPRVGACPAIWTFYWENCPGQSSVCPETGSVTRWQGDPINHEIDIEFPGRHPITGEHSFENALFSTWTSENGAQTVYRDNNETGLGDVSLGETSAHNDGQWRTYRFDWHTYPVPRVDFFVDGKHVQTNTERIPYIKGRFWIGVWFPWQWCGQPDFEQDFMLVNYVRITPFEGQPSRRYAYNPSMAYAPYDARFITLPQANGMPRAGATRIPLPINNLISHGDFEGSQLTQAGAHFNNSPPPWRVNNASVVTDPYNANSGQQFMQVNSGGSAFQEINGVYSNFALDFVAYARAMGGTGTIRIEFLNYARTQVLGMPIDITVDSDEFIQYTKRVIAPIGSKRVRITLLSTGGTADFDDLSLRLAT